MTPTLAPVLSVSDPAGAMEWFARLPGLIADPAQGRVLCGDSCIHVTGPTARPPGFRVAPFDHLALHVGDADIALAAAIGAGAHLHAAYTPDGPREISEFWNNGVRFAFLVGPESAPVELCALRQPHTGTGTITGLDHLGQRSEETAAAATALVERGGAELARHVLPGIPRPVSVHFIRADGLVWELFDEAPPDTPSWSDPTRHWIGVAPV